MAKLLNTAKAEGIYDNVPIDAETELSVELSALSITKTADKAVWVSGNLEYTIIVTNIYELDPDDPGSGLPVTGLTLTDTIAPEIATLVPGTVTIDGNPATEGTDYTFNAETGLLTFTSLAALEPGDNHTITFQVRLVQP